MGHFDGDAGTLLHIRREQRQAEQTEMVSFLLARGADPNARDNLGRTPLQLVRGNAETIRDGLAQR